MASDKKIITCANDPNFAIICTFFHKFSKPLSLGHPNIQLLQEWLENSEEVSAGLKQLHIKLLRKLRKTVHETAWETALSKFCWFYSAQDAWEIERFGYKKASLRVKLRVLRELVESQFECNGKFRTITQTMSADELRTEPIGRDKLGHSYWLAQDPDCNLRVFQEHLDEEIWQVVATNREELVTLINRLRGNEVVLASLVGAIDEDSSSNSCSGTIIKPPPPEERDESQDNNDTTVIINNNKDDNIKNNNDDNEEKINEKIPNIKIKFDKIVENNDSGNIDNANSVKIEKNKKCNESDYEESEEEEGEEEDGEEEEDDEDISEGEDDEKVDDKSKKTEEKTITKNSKKEPNKKNISKINDNDKKVKPLIISHSKITSSSATISDDKSNNNSIMLSASSKKRPLPDVEPDNKDADDITVVKKARPTLLDAKRQKNISKYEKFKDDSEDEDDDEEEDGDDDEEEEGEEEDGEEEEGDGEDEEEDTEEDEEEFGEPIEEKVLIVKGTGSGKDCKSCFQDLINHSKSQECDDEIIVGEAIEEDVFYVCGYGSGVDCLVGNPNKESESKSPPKATFYFGQPGCLKLSPVKKKPTSVNVETANEKNDPEKPATKIVNDKNENKNDSTSSKEEILNSSILTNGETEFVKETNIKTINETQNENHANDKSIQETISTSNNNENDKLNNIEVESTSKFQSDRIPEKVEEIENKALDKGEHITNSQVEICETNIANNSGASQSSSKSSNELKEINSTEKFLSPLKDKVKIIPEILITVNESVVDFVQKSDEIEEIKQHCNVEINSTLNMDQRISNIIENTSTSNSSGVPQKVKNDMQERNKLSENIEKSVKRKEPSENIEKIHEISNENTQIKTDLSKNDENVKVLTKIDNPIETAVVHSKSMKRDQEKETSLMSEKLQQDTPNYGESRLDSSRIEKLTNDDLRPVEPVPESLGLEKITKHLEIETPSESSTKSTQKSLFSENQIALKTEKSSEKVDYIEKLSKGSNEIGKILDIPNLTTVQNLSEVTKPITIEETETKTVTCKIIEKEYDAPLNIVPQSPKMPIKLQSSSISNKLKTEEITNPQISLTPPITNRKRRLSPAPDHNSSNPIEKPHRISESSETDLNSENIGEFIEDENENLDDDVGGKRARFRLKTVNTDLRKKIEAQRKIVSKDTGSSSSGEDERPRKKLSPRKQFAKNQVEETGKIFEKNEDAVISEKLEFRKHKTPEKQQSVSVIKSNLMTTDEATTSTNKIIEDNQKFEAKLESLITKENIKAIDLPEKTEPIKIFNKKISPNKLADKIEFLKQSKEKNLGKIAPPTTSSTVIQQMTSSAHKKIVSPIKQEPITIKKRISPKKIEDKIEILKQNIEKTVNLSGTQKIENIETPDLGRARKRSSPPKKIDENSSELSVPNPKTEVPDKFHGSKLHHDSKGGESDEEIPRKRTISEESSDIKAIIVNLNENKKSFEGHSSTDEDRSRKRTISENQSTEQITQQPAEKSSKTEESNNIEPENLEFNTKKREAARKIAEDNLKIKLRNSEDDDRPKKRTIANESTDQCDVKRSEKFSKIEKPISVPSSTSNSGQNSQKKILPPQEQIMPEDLSKKGSTQFPVNKKKALAIQTTTEERVKMKFPQKDCVETSDKKLKLSSVLPSSPDKLPEIETVTAQQKSEIQALGETPKLELEESTKPKIVSSSSPNSVPESEDEKSRKRTINTDMTPPQDRPLSEIKRDKIEEPQIIKNIVSPQEKLKIIERNEEKIKIVVKTCSVPDATPTLPILFERIVSDRASPEISKPIAVSTIKITPKKPTETSKKSPAASIKKSPLEQNKILEDPIDIKKESESAVFIKTRHTRRAGDTEPLLELTLAQSKRKSRQIISHTPQKLTPTAATSTICPPIGKKPKKSDDGADDNLEFVECKVEPKEEKLDEHNSDENKLEENPLEKVIEVSEKIDDKSSNNSANATKDTTAKPNGRQQRRKREIDTSNIIDTESEAAPMRQSRRIAQLKIREEAERRKLEEIALKKMKEDLKRKKKEEKQQLKDDPTVVTEPSESDSDYKDESDVELKKKFDKKKKGKKSGWSSGSNEEDDHDADDDDLFKYPASDHGSPLFKSDHEFSPESDIEDESQMVPLKRARTARKEGETMNERTGLTERDIDESCQKCGKSDHPEWILLCDKCDKGYHCSCLSPVLFIIPEGDWFCPPCQQEQLIAALEKHLKEFDNLILSKKLKEEERIKTLELEAAEIIRQKERDALEAAENELENKSHKKKSSDGTGKNRRRKASDNPCDDNSRNSENGTESSDGNSDEESDSRKKRSERRNQRKKDRKNTNRKKEAREGSSKSTESSSSENDSSNKSCLTDSDDEPIYKLRKRRQTNISYRFNDYDELINRAIKKDENQGIIYSDDAGEDEEGAGNLGRGKDISTIIEADLEEKARQKQKDDEEKGMKLEDPREKPESTKTKPEDDSGSDFEPLKTKQKSSSKKQRKKKNRKLNCLDISSEDDGSDEDFCTSSEDDDDDESFSVSSGSDSSLEMYRRRSKKGKTSRRAARERKKIRDFVVDGSDDETDEEEKPKIKKKRKQAESDFTESDLDDDEDELSEDLDSDELCDDDSTDSDQSGWRPSKRKKQKTASAQKKKTSGNTPANTINSGKSPRQTIGKEIPKILAAKKKPKRMDDDEKSFKASGIVKKNQRRISDTGSSSSSSDGAGGRKTRGRRLFYMDDYDDEESSDGGIKPGVKRPDTPPEEREKFIKRQEEIKRMLAEKSVNREPKEGAAKSTLSTVSQSTKGSEKTGAGDSLSAVPLSVIRAAKALDVDYLQRKGEVDEEQSENEDDDEAAAASAFGDELPDDFNPDDMDEEAIAKIMEEEDFAQHQQMKVLPSPGDVLKQQHKKLNTPPKMPPQSPQQQHTSVIQDPMMRKRLPMPTFHPLMRPSHPASALSHLPLLQSALTNPVGIGQPPHQLIPGVPMSHHRPPQQHPLMQPTQVQIPPPTSKPRGRRKKITPLRDPVEKAAAVAAATTTSTTTTTHQNSIPQNPLLPTNLSGKEAPPAIGVSSLPTPAIQPPIPSGNLNVAQPPQLYKPPSNTPQPSVITRMPQMPPRQRFPDQGSRYYPPPGAAGVPPNQLLPPHHRSSPGSLRHGLMPPIHHQPPPPHHTLRPSYVGGPPPLRPGGPALRPGALSSTLRHSTSSGPRGPLPPSSPTTTINIGNGIGRDQPLARQQQPGPPQFGGATHRSRHPAPQLNPYRPPLYGSPGYPPAPPPQHSVGSYPSGPPYGSYYPPPSLGPPTHSSTPSNSVIVAAAAAVSAAAASTVVVTPTRLAIPTSVVHHPPNQQPPPRLSSNHPNLPPPPHRPTKVTTLEPYDAKRTSPPLNLQQNQPSALIHSRENPNDDDDDDDDTANPTVGTTSTSGASEFSGLVSYFSSQHDEF